MSTQVSQRDFESEKRLRKDLKRTKALLADAQIMLDHLKNNAPSKREIAQLKNQVSAERTGSAPRATELIFSVSFLTLLSLSVVLESLQRKVTGKQGEGSCSNHSPQGLCMMCPAPGCCGWAPGCCEWVRRRGRAPGLPLPWEHPAQPSCPQGMSDISPWGGVALCLAGGVRVHLCSSCKSTQSDGGGDRRPTPAD